MEGLFFIAIGACTTVAYDIIKPFDHNDFDNVVKRNADLDAAMNFKVDAQHADDAISVVFMRSDELDILP